MAFLKVKAKNGMNGESSAERFRILAAKSMEWRDYTMIWVQSKRK